MSLLAWFRSILNFQDPRFMNARMPVQSYVWDTMNPNTPDVALTPPSPLCCLRFNPKVRREPKKKTVWSRHFGSGMLDAGRMSALERVDHHVLASNSSTQMAFPVRYTLCLVQYAHPHRLAPLLLCPYEEHGQPCWRVLQRADKLLRPAKARGDHRTGRAAGDVRD